MKESEILQTIIAIITLSIIIGLNLLVDFDLQSLLQVLSFSAIIITTNIFGKKLIARILDADVKHKIWQWERFGFKPGHHLKGTLPMGVILPIFLAIISLGKIKFMAFMTYETRALKHRAAKRFGPFSFTEMTDWHNALIGASGIIVTLLAAFIAYFIPGLGLFSKTATFYAFSNMIPFSNLDGAQIYFGSKVLYATLGIITLIFTAYALLLV